MQTIRKRTHFFYFFLIMDLFLTYYVISLKITMLKTCKGSEDVIFVTLVSTWGFVVTCAQTVVEHISTIMCAEVLWQPTGVLWWSPNKCGLLQSPLPPTAKKCHGCTQPGSPGGNKKVRYAILSRLYFYILLRNNCSFLACCILPTHNFLTSAGVIGMRMDTFEAKLLDFSAMTRAQNTDRAHTNQSRPCRHHTWSTF